MRRHFIFLIIPFIFSLDRWTKILIVKNLKFLESINITPFLSVVHTKNYGGAFGLLSQNKFGNYIFTILPVLIVAVLFYIALFYRLSLSKSIALLCILSGALGNLYDRIFSGFVIDFIDIYYRSYHWPAFNVADISITCGVCLWIFVELRDSFAKKSHAKC